MALTSIISVNYNQPELTVEFLKSIKENTNTGQIEVILVDNGSDMNHENTFKSIYPSLVYIRSDRNRGFAGGNNLGIKIAKGDYLLLLNNDTELTANFVDRLVDEFEKNPLIGILSPLILYFEDKSKIQYAGFTKMNYLTGRNRNIGHRETDRDQYHDKSQETSFVHGAAMMCRKADLKEVGLMDENYFLYYEELDWCEKFKKSGKKIWFTGNAKIYHKESMSVGKDSYLKTYFMHRNRMLYIRKNTNNLNCIIFGIYYIGFVCPVSILALCLRGKVNLIPGVTNAILWNLTNKKNSSILGYKSLSS